MGSESLTGLRLNKTPANAAAQPLTRRVAYPTLIPMTSIVGNATPGHFLYIDFFPSLESWTAAKQATEGNAEGEALDAELTEVANCPDNRLYETEES